MTVNRLKFLNDVSRALPGIATGAVSLEGADSLVFLNEHIYSYNSAISVNVKESEQRNLKGLVKAHDFYNCLSKLPGDEIDIEVTDETWEIKDGKIHVSMKLLPSENIFSRFESLKPSDDGWKDIDGSDLNSALKMCLIKNDNSNLKGIYFKENVAYATNKCVINRYSLKNDYPEVWINPNAVAELIKWNNFRKVQFDRQWLHFESEDGAVFSVRTMNADSYPIDRMKDILDSTLQKNVYKEIALTDSFYKAVGRAAAFSNVVEGFDVINIGFGTNVVIKGSRISGNFEEIVDDMTVDFAVPVELAFNVEEFLTSEKYFRTLKILSDTDAIDTKSPVRVILQNDDCVKLFSTVVTD